MLELRYNPLTDEWIIVSAETQKRPVQPRSKAVPYASVVSSYLKNTIWSVSKTDFQR